MRSYCKLQRSGFLRHYTNSTKRFLRILFVSGYIYIRMTFYNFIYKSEDPLFAISLKSYLSITFGIIMRPVLYTPNEQYLQWGHKNQDFRAGFMIYSKIGTTTMYWKLLIGLLQTGKFSEIWCLTERWVKSREKLAILQEKT